MTFEETVKSRIVSVSFDKRRGYDSNKNLIYVKEFIDNELYWEYDERGNIIHHKNSNGYEEWNEYDERGNKTYHKSPYGREEWMNTMKEEI